MNLDSLGRWIRIGMLGATMIIALGFAQPPSTRGEEVLVFISAFATGDDGGIHAYKLNEETGALKLTHRTGGLAQPFFMALSPDNKFLFSIHAPKGFGGKEHEQIASYKLAGLTGAMELVNRQTTSGTASCYLDVNEDGSAVYVANYSTGSVAAVPVSSTGRLGKPSSFFQHVGSSVNPQRQKEPHAHCIVVSPDNRFVFAADLGMDKLMAYQLDRQTGKITPAQQPFVRTPAGAGPRHLIFHPNGKHVYVVNELANSVTLFDYDTAGGGLMQRQTISTLPKSFDGTSYCADLKITPNGRFLYATNRGHDSIAAYKLSDDGKLTLLAIEPSLGKAPQNLAIAAKGRLLLCANMGGNNVVVFRIDPKAGTLQSIGKPTSMPGPSCIQIPRVSAR